jgi:tRNA (cytidine/uridine-2'-O-)-methyltransferase
MLKKPLFHFVLVTPDIPGNTGSIGRTSLALQARLVLIKPYGFSLEEKALRRAGLDYWKFVDVKEYGDINEFLEGELSVSTYSKEEFLSRLFFFTKWGKKSYFQQNFRQGDYLIFGSETKGLPQEIIQAYTHQTLHIPMLTTHIRSLNLANAATGVGYEVYRQLSLDHLELSQHQFAP